MRLIGSSRFMDEQKTHCTPSKSKEIQADLRVASGSLRFISQEAGEVVFHCQQLRPSLVCEEESGNRGREEPGRLFFDSGVYSYWFRSCTRCS
ncbi:hypothetical protein BaRGS_00004280 [Batillaria attramentaria]|uniref:Uncharacterized protein n=1 Tax=Batillaria attramentaria TaxID=370345 RepID=A0ABD0LZG6_9CAEN